MVKASNKPAEQEPEGSNETAEQEPKVTAEDEELNDQRVVRGPEEADLSDHEIVQRRTSPVTGQPEWPADGRFRRVFHIQVPRVSSRHSQDDATSGWDEPEHDSMHEANKVATLQDALNHGLHPRGEATFDDASDPDELSGSADLVYSVECVPASTERVEDTAGTYTPSAALADLGGTTLVEPGQGESDR